MRWFWKRLIAPLLDALEPAVVVEIGAESGEVTRKLLDWAAGTGALIHTIDPAPQFDPDQLAGEQASQLRLHRSLSLEVLPEIVGADLVLIDGDHNWYTVLNELRILERRAREQKRQPPVILLHDIAWPYGRRDLYYDPQTIPPEHRQPYAKRGIVPASKELEELGINDHLDNALREGGKANGVLCALEDFLKESKNAWRVLELPGLHGLGLIAPVDLLDGEDATRKFLAQIGRADFLRAQCKAIESERLSGEIRRIKTARELAATHAKLATAQQEITTLQNARSESGQDTERRDRVERNLRAEIDQLSEKLDAQSAAFKEQSAQIDSLTQELEQARHGENRQQPAGGSIDPRDLDRAHSLLRQELERTREALATESAELIDAQAQASHAKRRYQHVVHQLSATEAERDELEQMMEQSRVDTRDTRRRLRETTADLEAERETNELVENARVNAVANLETERLERREEAKQLARARDEVEDLRTQLERAEERRTQEQNRGQEFEIAAAQAKRELNSARQELQSQEQTVAERERQLNAATESSRRLAEDVQGIRESTQADLDQTRAETHRARLAEENLKRELTQLQAELEISTGQRQRLQSALARARADAELAQAERQGLDRRLAELVADRRHSRPDASQTDGLSTRLSDSSAQTGSHSAVAAMPGASIAGITTVSTRTPELPPLPPDPMGRAISGSDDLGQDMEWSSLPEPERQAQAAFIDKYREALHEEPSTSAGHDPLGLPRASDARGVLATGEHDQDEGQPSVDVVVCVHNALEDLRNCLWSLTTKTSRRFRLIIVNDGSDRETTDFLRRLASEQPAVHLIHQVDPPHGYTIAANLGLRASSSDYVILLNSDTIVSHGWLARLVSYGESHESVGVLGPLSNAASHQSIPELRHRTEWATNPLPNWLTIDGMAMILDRAAPRTDPRLPFINGFCYMIKREVIDTIGYFDEDHFASGYCEENDFSHRARQAGFELAVVDNAYVYHAKSKSFGVSGRKQLAKRNYEIFLDKHGRADIEALVEGMEHDSTLSPVRAAVSDAISSPAGLEATLSSPTRPPLSVVFILPGLADGGSGGSHSIYQEVKGMRRLGIPARIALFHKARDRAWATYDDAADVFELFTDEQDLISRTADADVISATHFKSVAMLAALRREREDFLPAYYVQDYEPFFTAPGEPDSQEAADSYTAVEDMLLFAKTHWLCNTVTDRHGVFVAKVEPSIDERLYQSAEFTPGHGPLRVTAMIRPRTPRRQPFSTVAVLEHLAAQFPGAVEITTFGCHPQALEKITRSPAILRNHAGLLRREAVAALLARSDVFLDMSMYQAFGRTALEAMACGCTAVVPRIGGVWEFAEHGKNALTVDTFDRETTFAALASLVQNRDKLTELKTNARATASRYSIVRAALSVYLTFEQEHRKRLS